MPIYTNVVSSNPSQAIQHYVIKCVSDLRQVGALLRALRFPPRYNLNIVESGVKYHNPNQNFININL